MFPPRWHVTHNLKYAVEYGTRLLMMHQGQVILDKEGKEKAAVKAGELLSAFHGINMEGNGHLMYSVTS